MDDNLSDTSLAPLTAPMRLGGFSKWIFNRLENIVAAVALTGLPRSFIRFGMVGSFGFCWDTATVYALKGVAGLYIAGTCGFLVAGTANWALNRIWTFRHLDHIAAHHQLLRFLMANAIGFIFNRGTFFALIAASLLCRKQPILAILAGTAAGLCFNYVLSKKFVFK
jgi:putative flippase GtrA